MKLTFSFFLFLISISSCNTQDWPGKTVSKDCFSMDSFSKLKEYINNRILFSGMGKFYIEYPPDKTQPYDSIKRPSKHPENVYDVRYDKIFDQINIENKSFEFSFLSKNGLVQKKDQTPAEHFLANEIYCYLLSKASEK